MIRIQKSPTADTRTCDFANVSRQTLLDSSVRHIIDVRSALLFFSVKLADAANVHDHDKISDIDGFHRDFVTGFKQTAWWDAHRKLNRHHLNVADGIPEDVNLIDVLDYIADCTMAGMARSGSVSEIHILDTVLKRAFANTAAMLKREVTVIGSHGNPVAMEPASSATSEAHKKS